MTGRSREGAIADEPSQIRREGPTRVGHIQAAGSWTQFYEEALRWPVTELSTKWFHTTDSARSTVPATELQPPRRLAGQATLLLLPALEMPPWSGSTACSEFDAVVFPTELGLAFMTEAEQHPPPCIVGEDGTVTVLVRSGTGACLGAVWAPLSIRAGPAQQITLPPTPGCRWDTTPWDPATAAPLPMPCGQDLTAALRTALRTYPPEPS